MIQKAHDIIRDQIRKFNGGYKSPEQIDRALYRGLLDYYNTLFEGNNTQRYNYYLTEFPCNISGSNRFDLPENFKEEENIYSLYEGGKHEGDILTDTEYLDRIDSTLLAPDLEHPIARIIGKKIEFFPSDSGNFVLTYYRVPIVPKYAYTTPNGRDIVFDEPNSIEIDIRESGFNEVVSNALGYLGISLQEQGLLAEKNLSRS